MKLLSTRLSKASLTLWPVLAEVSINNKLYFLAKSVASSIETFLAEGSSSTRSALFPINMITIPSSVWSWISFSQPMVFSNVVLSVTS